jgi:hypothetical protein
MFDVVDLNLAGQWHTPSIGELAELLVFYDRVSIRAPLSRIGSLAPKDLADMAYFRELVEARRIILVIDQLPLGEVAFELGLFEGAFGLRQDPAEAAERFQAAYAEGRPHPLWPETLRDDFAAAAWIREWDKTMERAWTPDQLEENYFATLVSNAEAKMKLITEPAFLATALEAYGAAESPKTRTMLASLKAREFEVGDHGIMGIEGSGPGSGAELLEFLSQADGLLDTIDGREGRDAFTSPDFDRWSGRLVAGSLRRVGVRQDISAFQTSVLGSSTIASAIDSEAKSFRDIALLLDRREPLAAAVRDRPMETSLAQAYFEEIKNTSWLSHGPGQVVRFSLFTAAGAATTPLTGPLGLLAGATLGAIDAFVVDKVIKGNACRSFVEGTLKPFVAAEPI